MSDAATVLLANAPVNEYTGFFARLLVDQLERVPKPLTALDFNCGRGGATFEICPHLSPGSRVVAIGQDRSELNVFHQELSDTLRPSIFLRKESSPRLPFAPEAFDLAWASLADAPMHDEPKQVLRQVVRALRPPGQILIAAPLRDTVTELRGAITPVLQNEEHSAVRALLQEDTPLASALEWQQLLTKAGAVEVGVSRSTLTVQVPRPVDEQPIFVERILPMWLEEGNPYRNQVLAQLNQRLQVPLEIRVHIACVYGRRGKLPHEAA